MSNRALTQAFNMPASITGTKRLVMFVIADSASSDTGHSFMGVEKIARYAGVKPRAAQYALRALEGLGIIRTEIQKGGLVGWDDHTRPNLYVWQYDAVEALIARGGAPDDPGGGGDDPVHDGAPGARRCTPPGARRCTPPGARRCTPPVHDGAPNPSLEPPSSNFPSVVGGASARESAREPEPDDEIIIEEPDSPTAPEPRRAERPERRPPRRGTRIPADFAITDSMTAWAAEKIPPDVDLLEETQRFHDYWAAIPGARGVKLDWEATWRNWMRKTAEFRARDTGRRYRSQADIMRDTITAAARADADQQETIIGLPALPASPPSNLQRFLEGPSL